MYWCFRLSPRQLQPLTNPTSPWHHWATWGPGYRSLRRNTLRTNREWTMLRWRPRRPTNWPWGQKRSVHVWIRNYPLDADIFCNLKCKWFRNTPFFFFFFKAANQLQNKYTTTAQDLNSRYNLTTQAQSRAETLKRRADKLATDTTAKLKKLKGKRIVVTIKQIVPLMITEYKDDFSQFTFALRGQILN